MVFTANLDQISEFLEEEHTHNRYEVRKKELYKTARRIRKEEQGASGEKVDQLSEGVASLVFIRYASLVRFVLQCR